MKKLEIYERAVTLGNYIVENKTTIRETARKFKISKSTVHKNVTQDLKEEDNKLYQEVCKQLNYNKSIRHIRGGEATKQKRMKINKK